MVSTGCNACKDGVQPPFPFSMAFQPIVDVDSDSVFAYEALVRGLQGESAASVLSQVTPENRYAFDQTCRVCAITVASRLGLGSLGPSLSINFLPGAVYSPIACIRLTLQTARRTGFPVSRLIFEIVENEEVIDHQHVNHIASEYRRQGMRVALDDFGAGYSGLNLLADVSADVVKLDMKLIRNLHLRPRALAIVGSMSSLAKTLGISLIAEGVETVEEFDALRTCGISLMQGYLLAKPAFEALPAYTLPPMGKSAMPQMPLQPPPNRYPVERALSVLS